MRGNWLTRMVWGVAIAIPLLLLAWGFAPRAVLVDTVTVREATFERFLDAEGRTRVRERYVVAAPLAGRLLRVSVKAGDAVEKGQALGAIVPGLPVLLDTRTIRELEQRVGTAEADAARTRAAVERSEAALTLARAEQARARDLTERGFASRQALDRAERDVEIKDRELAVAREEQHAAAHQLALAQSALFSGRQDATKAPVGWTLRAPVTGRVLRVLQESETPINAGAPVLEIGDPRDLEVIADVLTVDAAAIPVRAAVEFRQADRPGVSRGRVRLVEPGAFTKVSALGVEEQRTWVVMDFVDPALPPAGLGDAYRVDVRIEVERRERALVVPVAALFRSTDHWQVFVQEGARARLRDVEIVSRSSTLAHVSHGLAAGERVIVYPADTLHDGVLVRTRKIA